MNIIYILTFQTKGDHRYEFPTDKFAAISPELLALEAKDYFEKNRNMDDWCEDDQFEKIVHDFLEEIVKDALLEDDDSEYTVDYKPDLDSMFTAQVSRVKLRVSL